jgi:hypothetical protein
MKLWLSLLAIGALIMVAVGRKDSIVGAASAPPPSMGFFVTSAKSKTGNLGAWLARTESVKAWPPLRGREIKYGEPT